MNYFASLMKIWQKPQTPERTTYSRKRPHVSLFFEQLEERTLLTADINNGVVRLGVNDSGALIITPLVAPITSAGGTSLVGLRYMPTNYEAAAPAAPVDGWGVGSSSVSYGGAEASTNTNLTAVAITSTANSAICNATAAGNFQVTHNYHPSTNANVYEVTVTIRNISASTLPVRYRRTIDWDVEPTALTEYVTLQGTATPGVLNFTNNGFNSQDPFSFAAGTSGDLVNSGPSDLGATVTFDLGTLAPGASRTFFTYYGAAADRTSAVAAITAVGMQGYTLASPSSSAATVGTPNTFFYGFNLVTTGVTITPTGGSTAVTEGGATDTYSVVLNSAPSGNVTIALTPDTQETVAPTSLVFTPANWNTSQTVTVTAVDDAIAQGTHTGTITHTATSGDPAYNGISIAGMTVNITDNDVAGVTITQSKDTTDVTEGGTTDSYTVVLTSQPTSDVTISLTPDSQVTVTPSTLIFTPANWNAPQTATVTAVDDTVVEGTHTGTITHAAGSGDTAYNGIVIASVTANIIDNDVPAGIIINQTGGSTYVAEGGVPDFYSVVLASRPLANVIITLQPDSQVKVLPTSLTFTPLNWNIPQTATVTAIDDILVEGPHTGTIAHSVFSGDPAYNSFAVANVTANITDNDFANGKETNDIIAVTPSADLSKVLVTVNGKTGTLLGTIPQVNVQSFGGTDTISVNHPAIPTFVDGGNGTDRLIINGQAGANNTFVLTSSSLIVNGVAVTWANVESLIINGQSANDTFTVKGVPALPVTLLGSVGNNMLRGPDATSLWQITGSNTGTLNGTVKFAGMQNLTGGTANDTFLFSPGQGVTGQIDGGTGSNILDYSLYTTPITVNLPTSTSNGIGKAGFLNVGTILGGKGLDKIVGLGQTNVWSITGTNTGNINASLSFFGIENLTGGSGDDTFQFTDGRGVTGKVDGGGGANDLLDYSGYTTPVTVNLQILKATGTGTIGNIEKVQGGSASDTMIAAGKINTWNLTGTDAGTITSGPSTFTYAGMENITGGGSNDTFITAGNSWSGKLDGGLGVDTLVSDDSDHTWNITGTNAGTLDGLPFQGMENYRGGAGADTFALAAGQKITGKFDGGTGTDILDFSAFTTGITLNLQTSTITNMGGFLNVEQFKGGTGTLDTLIARNTFNNWNLTGLNTGDVINGTGTIDFSGFEFLTGGAANDNFNMGTGGGWSGILNGGLGLDTLTAFAGGSNIWTATSLNGNKFTGIETRQ